MKKLTLKGHNLIHIESVDSTNNFTANLYKAGDCQSGTVIMADFQTKGKGQRGKVWQSDNDKNLTFSILIQPSSLKPENLFYLNIAVSLALFNTLEDLGIMDVKIKWPNDVYIKERKVSGILIENSISTEFAEHSIIGIGLNVNQLKFPKEVEATSISEVMEREYDKMEILSELLTNLDAAFYQVDLKNFRWLKNEYEKNLYLKNQSRWFEHNETDFEGVLMGIDEYGRLRIFNKSLDREQIFELGEIKFLK